MDDHKKSPQQSTKFNPIIGNRAKGRDLIERIFQKVQRRQANRRFRRKNKIDCVRIFDLDDVTGHDKIKALPDRYFY